MGEFESGHELDEVDDWELYDQHTKERNFLINGKKESEDGFVNTIVQLSSAALLLVPSLIGTNLDSFGNASTYLLIVGLGFLAISLISSISEQFLSSIAYGQQIKKTDQYYTKKINDRGKPRISFWVEVTLLISFVSFIIGVLCISIWITRAIGG